MLPELFKLPIINTTIKSYGLMMVIGFFFAMWLMKKLAKTSGQNPETVTNIALYTLLMGVLGARIFYVIHYFDQFSDNLLSVFALWNGGLELLGGVLLGLVFLLFYLFKFKLPVRKHLDIIVIGLMLGISFGRIGCFLNGCCFGKPTDCPLSVQFPYGSIPYTSHAFAAPARGRDKPILHLPSEYYLSDRSETNQRYRILKPKDMLTDKQLTDIKTKYRDIRIHPTQLYSSANAFILCGILILFWRKFRETLPGSTFAMMLILYGITRFIIEAFRDDNPFEHAFWTIYQGGTISQNISIYLVISGLVLIGIFLMQKQKQNP